jgi:hypothetical protein
LYAASGIVLHEHQDHSLKRVVNRIELFFFNSPENEPLLKNCAVTTLLLQVSTEFVQRLFVKRSVAQVLCVGSWGVCVVGWGVR